MKEANLALDNSTATCPVCGCQNACKFSMRPVRASDDRSMYTDFYTCYRCGRNFITESGDPDSAPDGVVAAKESKVPPEFRTRPMNLAEAAKHMGYKGSKKQVAKRLRKLIDDESIIYEKLGRQQYVFSKNDFPQEVWGQLTPLRPNSR